jgi:Gas vesicle synthesis protein GvpO
VADEQAPSRRPPVRDGTGAGSRSPRREPGARQRAEPAKRDGDATRGSSSNGTIALRAAAAARRALRELTGLTGHDGGTVISIERCDDGWQVGVEVVETHRIPDSADILACYEVRLEADGELASYRRIRRYSRGQTDRGTR